jgi:hypothetical protein
VGIGQLLCLPNQRYLFFAINRYPQSNNGVGHRDRSKNIFQNPPSVLSIVKTALERTNTLFLAEMTITESNEAGTGLVFESIFEA